MKKIFMIIIGMMFCYFEVEASMIRPNIILFGLPGSGKGTLSQRLVEKSDYVHISPGDLLRKEIRSGSKLGKEIGPILARGDYVSEDLTFKILKNKIVEASKNNVPIIFDGYPRSEEALNILDGFLKELGMNENTIVLELKVGEEKLLDRVLKRTVCRGCNKVYTSQETDCSDCKLRLERRNEDSAEILKKRIKHYNEVELLLIKILSSKGYRVFNIESDDANKVFDDFYRVISMKE